jgi:hypothetical protein
MAVFDLQTVRERIGDYKSGEYKRQLDELVALWRAHHPAATQEAPSYLHPLMRTDREEQVFEKPLPGKPRQGDWQEHWANDIYQVTVRRWEEDPVFRSRGGCIQLGINAIDGTARHDWRDFQTIKNQLAGPECEAFELYPAESRLLDPSNYYTLWCFPGMHRINVGVQERRVLQADEALAPQRPFAESPKH